MGAEAPCIIPKEVGQLGGSALGGVYVYGGGGAGGRRECLSPHQPRALRRYRGDCSEGAQARDQLRRRASQWTYWSLGGLAAGGTSRRGGVAGNGTLRTTPGLASLWGSPAPGGPDPGRLRGLGGRRPAVRQLGVGQMCWPGVIGCSVLVRCRGIHLHKVLDSSFPTNGGWSRSPHRGGTHHSACGCGHFGAPPRAGAGGLPRNSG